MTGRASDKLETLDKLIDMASEVTGVVAAGAAIAYLQPGPEAAALFGVAGVGLSTVLRGVAMEMKDRFLGHREEVRIGAAVVFAAEKIRQNMENGQQIRQDGFFQEQPGARSDAEEIVEGVLLAAQREHEERKTKYYANILATAAFDAGFSSATLNHILTLAERLTYRQLCLLHLFSNPQPIPLRDRDYRGATEDNIGWETLAVLAEVFDLYQASTTSSWF